MAKTWKDINEVVQLTLKGRSLDLFDLEVAFSKGDIPSQKRLINALRGEDKEFEAEICPLGGLRLDINMQRKRLENLYKKNPQDLINEIYTTAVKMLKKKKKASTTTVSEYEFGETKEIDPPVTITVSEAIEMLKKKKRASTTITGVGRSEMTTSAVMGADGKIAKTSVKTPKAPKEPMPKTKTLPKKSMKDQIVFTQLQSNPELSHFVPEVDEGYEFPMFTAECAKFLDHSLNIWLHGGTGCGKSSLIEQICAIGKLPLMYCSFHEDVKPDQLFGGFRLVDGNTVWQDGPVTKAYRDGLVLLLDEIDGLPPEIAFSLYAVTDHKPLVLAENDNEVIQPHPNFRVVATGNTHGRGDESGMYSGTNVLNRAFLNRFRVWYKVEYPSRKIYQRIIQNEGVSGEIANTLAQLASEINSSFANGTLTETFSLRDAREIAKIAFILDGDIKQALKVTLMNRLSSIEQASVSEMFRRFVR
ncbi:MAG: hypothetical protein D4S01_11355 [Dehalococcoidia bacterium]|nr:MAG: hypothetical protein D4S01_11355 [Dehalococcoidia bacterium]